VCEFHSQFKLPIFFEIWARKMLTDLGEGDLVTHPDVVPGSPKKFGDFFEDPENLSILRFASSG